ncbi:MAG: hypothetical protein V2J24_13390 [Pseudomonadales bacterium]|nr:hypothetical protein [Pseudomonadales bacterium]
MDLPRRITAQALLTLSLLVAAPARGDDCDGLRARLDAAADLDPRHARSVEEPWLRRDAFLRSELQRALATGERGRVAVVLDAMATLELQALELEPGVSSAALQTAARCARIAVTGLAASPSRLEALAREPLPALYLSGRRLLGGYVFARPFLRAGAARWSAGERRAIAAGLPPPTSIHRPEPRPPETPGALARLLLGLRAGHPAGWPVPDGAALDRLGAAFAPELATHAIAEHTLPGALSGRNGRPFVDTGRPRAYLDHGYVRWGQHVLLQLSYTFWFTRRPRTWFLDPYGGAVDGLVLRVTVGDDGRALLWESIHPCGCFYTVATPSDREFLFLDADETVLEPPLRIAGPQAAATPRLHYTSDEHLLRALTAAGPTPAGAQVRGYTLEPWASLLAAGPERPPFDDQGLLRGSERGERLFLWPSGIRSPGAMRTPGRHATAFLGRRRFEAPELLDGMLRKRPRTVPRVDAPPMSAPKRDVSTVYDSPDSGHDPWPQHRRNTIDTPPQ